MLNVKIVSDGTAKGTQILDTDGSPLRGVKEIFWSIGGGNGKIATTEMVVELCRIETMTETKIVASYPRTGEQIEIVGFLLPNGDTVKF